MQKFIYLKIISVITTIILAAYLLYVLGIWYYYYNTFKWSGLLLITYIFFLLNHSILVLYLFKNYYPNKEVPRGTKVYYRVVMTGSWVVTGIFAIGAVYQFINRKTEDIIPFVLATLVILFIFQLPGASHFIKMIQQNARQKLEDSFI